MATYYRTGVETYSIIGTADERDSLEGRIPDGSTYFAVDENMFYTFYDGQWYETLPEAARLYHDDVGTDTKPIKLVGGVATVVANELAEDSKVVHNTGDETVAGQKTFTSPLLTKNAQTYNQMIVASRGMYNTIRSRNYTDDDTKYDDTFQLGTTYATSVLNSFFVRAFAPRMVKGDASEDQTSMAFYLIPKNDGTGTIKLSYRKTASGSATDFAFGSFDGTSFSLFAPTYTTNNAADNIIVTRSMLAQTPTVVHTTGNETIAGNKTFSGTLNAPKIRSASVAIQMEVGTWYKMYTITPVSVGQQIFWDIFNTSSISSLVDAKLRIQIPNSNFPYDPAGNLFNVGSIMVGKLAKTNDGKIEVWLCKTSGTAQYILLNAEYLDFLVPTPVGTAGTEPVQGNDYPLVVNLGVVS